MGYTLTTQPTAYPVSLTEAKNHLRVDSSTDDSLITALISAATDYVQNYTRRQMVAAVYTVYQDEFDEEYSHSLECYATMLPFSPATSIVDVTYYDTGGTLQTVTSTVYELIADVDPPRIRAANNQLWPTSRGDVNDVRIKYRAGYAAPFTADATANTITCAGRLLTNGDVVRLSNTGGALPAGLSTLTDYYIVSASGSTCSLSLTSGGAAIDITGAGTGTHFIGEVPAGIRQAILLLVGHWYENREASITGVNITDVPMAVTSLLWSFRIVEMF